MSQEFGNNDYVFSTDCLGRFGKLDKAEKVWGFATQESSFAGFEVVAWKKSVAGLQNLPDGSPKIAGLHGRMGVHSTQPFFNKLRNLLIDAQIANTEGLIGTGNKFKYILVHSVALEKNGAKKTILENKDKINIIFVENHIQKNALFQAVFSTFRLRGQGVNAGLLIDIVHCFNELGIKQKEMPRFWDEMINHAQMALDLVQKVDKDTPVAFHLPIGTNKNDSLPIDELTMRQWKKLSELIHKKEKTAVVLENQQQGLGLIFLTDKQIAKQRNRNEQVFELLTTTGVILI